MLLTLAEKYTNDSNCGCREGFLLILQIGNTEDNAILSYIYSQNYIDNLQGLYLKHFYYAFYQLKMRNVLSNFQLIT